VVFVALRQLSCALVPLNFVVHKMTYCNESSAVILSRITGTVRSKSDSDLYGRQI